MNNSKSKNYLLVAIAATTLALASCTSARELSYQSSDSTPLYSVPESDDKLFTNQPEPKPDFTGKLSTATDEAANEDQGISTAGLMLPSDMDDNTLSTGSEAEPEPLIADASNDLGVLLEDNEPVKKLPKENTEPEIIFENTPAPAPEVLRTTTPLMTPSNTPERSEPKTNSNSNSNSNSKVNTTVSRSVAENIPVKPETNNPDNEHFTVIITTDGVGINSDNILSQLEDAIASIQRGEHRDVVITSEKNQSVNKRISKPAITEELDPIEDSSDEFDDELVKILEDEIKDNRELDRPNNTTKKTPPPLPHREVLTLALGGGRAAVIDEALLIDWETAVAEKSLGFEITTDLPAWLLQGIEWITHAPTEEPLRSQTIMPIYRHMEDAGMLDDVNQNSMTPTQVVEKLRLFVDEAKSTQ